jgi:hypothetical protein
MLKEQEEGEDYQDFGPDDDEMEDASLLGTMLADVQGRLLFRAQQKVQDMQLRMLDLSEDLSSLVLEECQLLEIVVNSVPRHVFQAFAIDVIPSLLLSILAYVPKVKLQSDSSKEDISRDSVSQNKLLINDEKLGQGESSQNGNGMRPVGLKIDIAAISTRDVPISDTSLLSSSISEKFLFQIKHLILLRDLIASALEVEIDGPPMVTSPRSPTFSREPSSSSVSFVASLLSFDRTLVRRNSLGKTPTTSSPLSYRPLTDRNFSPTDLHDIRVRLDMELKRLCNEFCSNRIYSCTSTLNSWNVRLLKKDIQELNTYGE